MKVLLLLNFTKKYTKKTLFYIGYLKILEKIKHFCLLIQNMPSRPRPLAM